MEKSIIIIGDAGTGKSTVAKALASNFKEANRVFISGNESFNRFGFSACTPETKLVIIDEVKDSKRLEDLIPLTAELIVDKQGKEPFTINPKIVVVCNEKITLQDIPKGLSFSRRFTIIECTKELNI